MLNQLQQHLPALVLWLCGILPTCGVCTWCVVEQLPFGKQAVAEELSTHLGWPVRIAVMEQLRPGEVLLGGIEVFDPETDFVLAQAQQLTLRRRGETYDLAGPSLKVSSPGTSAAWQLLESRLRGRGGSASLRLSIDELEIASADGSQHLLSAMRCELRTDRDTPFFSLVATPASDVENPDPAAPEPLRLDVVRYRNQAVPDTRLQLKTSTPVPVGLLAMLPAGETFRGVEGAEVLQMADSQQATFAGTVLASLSIDGWSLECTGRVDALQLQNAPALAQGLEANATLYLQRLLVQNGQIQLADGLVQAGAGRIERHTLDMLAERLHLQLGDAPPLEVPFDQLQARFRLDAQGLLISGNGNQPILRRGMRPLLAGDGSITLDGIAYWLSQPAGPAPTWQLLSRLPGGQQR